MGCERKEDLTNKSGVPPKEPLPGSAGVFNVILMVIFTSIYRINSALMKERKKLDFKQSEIPGSPLQ